MSRIRIASITISFGACALWSFTIAGVWVDMNDRAMPVIRLGAATLAVSAVVCWMTWWIARHDPDKAVLVRTLAAAVAPRREAQTAPMRRVR